MATRTSIAAGKRANLGAVLHAAEYDGRGEAEVAAVGPEAVGDLGRQLASRAEHENTAAAPGRRPAIGGQSVQDRQGEGRGLAGARLGDAQQVATREDVRDGQRLNGRGLVVAFFSQGFE